jgi:hypothetical protein
MTSTSAAGQGQTAERPALRLYLLSTVAGALEPCGCSKDQLGGIDHLAAYIEAHKETAEAALLVAAGPLFFQDPTLTPHKKTQDAWKAEALAAALGKLDPKLASVAWAPGANDWAAGGDLAKQLRDAAAADMLAANVAAEDLARAGLASAKMHELSGIKVGVIGIVDPAVVGGAAGVAAHVPTDALKEKVASFRNEGVRLVVVSAALQRGEALRLVDQIPDIDVLVVGKPSEKGHVNDKPKPAQIIGDTLIVETSNHLQTVAVVDIFVREAHGTNGRIKLADAGGVARAEELVSVSEQIRDLEHRINGWEKDKGVKRDDLAARKADLDGLRRKKAELESHATPPPSGSYFKYSLVEVRDRLGASRDVSDVILAYYKRVNAHNRDAFKDRRPAAAEAGKASYTGVDACTTCHADERAVWDKTAHAHAYATLEKQAVEFNLDCVGCHVTGYEQPGGSTVTHVDKLKDVGCEVCHGPGSLHAKEPEKKGLIIVKPEPKSCVTECHHPPHVEGFDPVVKMPQVLGPGHGM